VLDAHHQPVEVPSDPDRRDVPRRKRHLPALARVKPVGAVVDPADLAAEPVGVRRGIEARLKRIAGHGFVGRTPSALEDPPRRGAELPGLVEVGPDDPDDLGAVDRPGDPDAFAAHRDPETILLRVDENSPVAVAGDRLRTAAGQSRDDRGGEDSGREIRPFPHFLHSLTRRAGGIAERMGA
jgi:hypothetical protein